MIAKKKGNKLMEILGMLLQTLYNIKAVYDLTLIMTIPARDKDKDKFLLLHTTLFPFCSKLSHSSYFFHLFPFIASSSCSPSLLMSHFSTPFYLIILCLSFSGCSLLPSVHSVGWRVKRGKLYCLEAV